MTPPAYAPALAAACLAAACASAAPDRSINPDHLAADQLTRIAGICQNMMGLQPSERLTAGTWPGRVHLPPLTSHYQGCVTSLSDSLQQGERQPAASEPAAPVASSTPVTPAVASSVAPAPLAVGSFFYASAGETLRREQRACASLGFRPPLAPFASCVRDLQAILFAIDHPIE